MTRGILDGDFKRFAPMSIEEIICEEINEADKNDERDWMKIGKKYMSAQNDIYSMPRTVIGEGGELVSARNIADNRIGHAFLREMVEQKCNYLLGRPWSWKCEDEENKKILNTTFDDEFYLCVMNAARDAVMMGIGWLHFYYDSLGRLKCRNVDSQEIYPIWKDGEKKNLDAVIRKYNCVEYCAQEKKIIQRVQFWDENGVTVYEERGGRYFELEKTKPHATRVNKNYEEPFSWGKVPFVAIKYNEECVPLIKWTKDLIDEYDKVVSGLANAIEDQPNSVIVLKNYDGQKLDEFRKNLAQYRAVKVSDDGGVDVLNTPIGYEAASEHLGRIRQDIYAFGRGVDTRSERVFSAKSGVALKHEYAALDIDCNGLEINIRRTLREALFFIGVRRGECGEFLERDCGNCFEDVEFVFNRDIIINEFEAIEMFVMSENLISKKTNLANHPWVRNVNDELKEIENEGVKNE